MSERRPLPRVTVETDLLWSAATRDELAYQRCHACGGIVFYPRGHCPRCGSLDLSLHTSAGRGTIYSMTTVRLHPDPYFAGKTPYVVGLVDLDEGFRMLAEIDSPIDTVRIGDRVEIFWESDQIPHIPLFTVVAGIEARGNA
jgi:uncharacterized OB-fold protein